MSAPVTISSGVGFRSMYVFELDSNGRPKATGVLTAYDGVKVGGVKSLSIQDPEQRKISHIGDDHLLAMDALPPTEGMSGSLTTSRANETLDAMLNGTIVRALGEINLMGINTDKDGSPAIQVGALMYRQAVDQDDASATYGKRIYQFRLMPRLWLTPQENTWDDNPEVRTYSLTPQICNTHLWGTAFSASVDGYSTSQMIRGTAEYKPQLGSWLASGSASNFPFLAGFPAQATTKIAGVWVNGVLKTLTTDYTVTVMGIGFVVPPAAASNVCCLYETL